MGTDDEGIAPRLVKLAGDLRITDAVPGPSMFVDFMPD
jgi:hypothetical protein